MIIKCVNKIEIYLLNIVDEYDVHFFWGGRGVGGGGRKGRRSGGKWERWGRRRIEKKVWMITYQRANSLCVSKIWSYNNDFFFLNNTFWEKKLKKKNRSLANDKNKNFFILQIYLFFSSAKKVNKPKLLNI